LEVEGYRGIEAIGDEHVRYRLSTVRIALVLGLVVALGTEVYLGATWDRPHRPLITAIVAAGIATVILISLLPVERIMRSRWREPFFVGWAGAMVVLIALGTAADGGPISPIVLLFPLPVIFAALSYPLAGVLIVTGFDLAAFATVALAEPAGTPESAFIAFALACIALMCVLQARNRHVQQGQLEVITAALESSQALSRQRAEQQREAAEFSRRALAGAPVDVLMQDAVETLERTLSLRVAGVLECRPDRDVLVIGAHVGLSDELAEMEVPSGPESQSGYTLAVDRPVIVDDWSTERRFVKTDMLRRLGVASGVTVVIKVEGKPFGILGAQASTPHRFGDDDVSFLEAIANALANAIEHRREAEEAQHRALHDPLTGLPNRALFEDRLGRVLAEQERRESSVAVIFLDVDHLKLVNDSFGHQAGDELLRALAPRLTAALGPGDTVARFGGDEFGLLLEDVPDERGATRVAERIAEALASPFIVRQREHFVTASAGIAVGGPGSLPEALIRDADAAMYRAKERGRARYEIFDEAMRVRVAHRLQTENELRTAIERGELRVHYQPVISLSSGELTGAEALVRWEHPRHGLMPPSEFIPVAEESGLIDAIGRWLLDAACRQAVEWHHAHPDRPPLGISVNLSARQLADRDVTEIVRHALEGTGLDPACLSLEVTERALVEGTAAVATSLAELKQLGVMLALDDFGTRYSSLGSLRDLPFDAIKLDRTFVERPGSVQVDNAILSAVVALAQTLHLRVIAEGIESEEQLAVVKALGCHLAQGFYFSRAVPADEFGRMLADHPHAAERPG
jgi:diguanylate cyclase (GGDEF)-like protein